MKRRVLHLLAQVPLGPEDGQPLIERLASGASGRAEERHPMLAVGRATQAWQQLLVQPSPAARPASKGRGTPQRQEAKAARRRQRREGDHGRAGPSAWGGSTRDAS